MSARHHRAIQDWATLSARLNLTDAESDRLERAEASILSRRPSCDEDLRLILAVVRHNLIAGPRSDELDIRALELAEVYLCGKARMAA